VDDAIVFDTVVSDLPALAEALRQRIDMAAGGN
jgi:hypothetical protein